MKQIPNILEKTGISRDYILAFGSIDNYIRRIEKKEEFRWIRLAENSYLNRPILKYEAYFSQAEYEQVVTDKNREIIKNLDRLVEEVNKMRENKQKDYEKLSKLWKKAKEIIFGKAQELLEDKI
ncbi:hypothetical protein HYS72_01010 [Candidatus Pacearchaeota archaeon]|nr:hypothetical protein [Candidatus Pacearchaeota archaeon]MBI2057075.1 hypothetical protein [Candidatus Pacearchaeota archaeon]